MREHLFSLTKKDFEIKTFKSGGKGGQHQNKTDSGVRIVHKETGFAAESRDGKSQYQNKKIAFQRLTSQPKFIAWLKNKSNEIITKKTIEQKVDELMNESNIKVEVKVDGKWVDEKDIIDG